MQLTGKMSMSEESASLLQSEVQEAECIFPCQHFDHAQSSGQQRNHIQSLIVNTESTNNPKARTGGSGMMLKFSVINMSNYLCLKTSLRFVWFRSGSKLMRHPTMNMVVHRDILSKTQLYYAVVYSQQLRF